MHPSMTFRRAVWVALACAAASTAAHEVRADIVRVTIGAPSSPPPKAPAIHGSTPAQCPVSCDPTVRSCNPNVRDLAIVTTSLSTSTSDTVGVRLILPPGWSPTATRTWPVLYLMTGHGASYASWTCDTFLEQYLAGAGVIVVMPDVSRAYSPSDSPDTLTGGIPGVCSDWEAKSSDGSPEAWETFHLTELRELLESQYHASTTRAIAGLSMGALGVMAYPARHPGMFVAAVSFSGMLHTNSTLGFGGENAIMLEAGQDTNAPWGYFPGTPGALLFGTQWPEHDPTELASSLLGLSLIGVSAGNGSAGNLPGEDDSAGAEFIESSVLSMSQDFVTALTAANGGKAPANLVADFYGNGTHSWPYWDAEVCRALPLILSALHVPYTPTVACPTP